MAPRGRSRASHHRRSPVDDGASDLSEARPWSGLNGKKVSLGGRPTINLLSTVMRCGECGGQMKVRTHPVATEKTKVYACSNYAVGKLGRKNSLRRPVDVVNETVVSWLLANLLRQ